MNTIVNISVFFMKNVFMTVLNRNRNLSSADVSKK